MPTWWIRAEDLILALVGPFDTEAQAQDHVRFCEARGDGATMVVFQGDTTPQIGQAYTITHKEDRA